MSRPSCLLTYFQESSAAIGDKSYMGLDEFLEVSVVNNITMQGCARLMSRESNLTRL